MNSILNKREARKGQGMKSLAGSRGSAPWQGLGRQTQRHSCEAKNASRSGAEDDHYGRANTA